MRTLYAYYADAGRHSDARRTFVPLRLSCRPAPARNGAQGTPDSMWHRTKLKD